jgi:glycyl-tRNA synthetase (class II)
MVKDVKTGECFRADHLIKNAAEALISVRNLALEHYLFHCLGQEDFRQDKRRIGRHSGQIGWLQQSANA